MGTPDLRLSTVARRCTGRRYAPLASPSGFARGAVRGAATPPPKVFTISVDQLPGQPPSTCPTPGVRGHFAMMETSTLHRGGFGTLAGLDTGRWINGYQQGLRRPGVLSNSRVSDAGGSPSESRVKRGDRVVHGNKELIERLGRNDTCPCESGRRFQVVLHADWVVRRKPPRPLPA